MKHLLFFIYSFLIAATIQAQHKSRVSFTNDWRFKLDSVQSYQNSSQADESWTALDLPHDWSIEGNFSREHAAGTGGGALPGGMGWYLKTFTVPAHQKHKRLYIEFDGVYRNSEVYLNGKLLGKRPNGYISFHYELTPHLKYGSEKNIIAVKVDNSKQPNSRWYSGSGIYRNVWLTMLDPVHIDLWGTFITTPVVNAKTATVNTRYTIVNNKGGTKKVRFTQRIISLDGGKDTMVLQQDLVLNDPQYEGNATVQITNPRLWSVEKPQLYKSITTISEGEYILDEYETFFGIRSFRFDGNKGFFLNGQPIKILGVCNHHDLGALGAAINTRAIERQLELLKAMGCNGIRTSHNPPAPELLDLADKMGFIVMDESYDMWAKSKSPFDYSLDWDQWHKKDLEDFIRRDRNHPSVFMWSVGNEIYEQWGDDSIGRVMARNLVSIVQSLDTTRPVTTANNFVTQWNHLINSNAFELIGYNYHHKQWADFKKDHPGKKLIITESTSALQTRGHYDKYPVDSIRRWPEAWDKPFTGGNADLTVSAYDHVSTPWGSTHEESVKILLKHDFISGMYIWTGFDYLGEPTPYPWPARSSYFGIIDLAGFPKDVYYMYQSVFTQKPVLHLVPHWNW
ncbi:MAG: glycoside hydrolase family 2 TIM barrel-domain containing protein, partial [Flavisolibacter sp.]